MQSEPEPLRHAREALYRPGADDADRARFAALQAELDVERVAEQQAPAPCRRPRRTLAAAALVAVAVAVVALALVVRATAGASTAAPTPIATSGPIASLLARSPGLLPAAWRGADVVASSDTLDGATPLSAAATTALLVVRCPASDRSFQVQAAAGTGEAGGAVRYGACGRLQFLALSSDVSRQVLVTTRGVQPFSAALLARPA